MQFDHSILSNKHQSTLVIDHRLLRMQVICASRPDHQLYRKNKSRNTTGISLTLAVDGKSNYGLSFHALAFPFPASSPTSHPTKYTVC